MSRSGQYLWRVVGIVSAISLSAATVFAQAKPETVLAYQPAQPDVDYDIPAADQIPNCKVEVERTEKGSGWVVYDPQGQILRRFMDTDGDRVVDEFRYFKHGLEVYRDLDTDGNKKIDQSRWLNTGGSRWGIDKNEDGKIESWKVISAEEATREAVLALVTKDPQRLVAVLLNADDIKTLGIEGETATKLAARIKEASAKFSATSNSKIISPSTRWVRFDCSMLMPNTIPTEAGKTKSDLLVYENVMAIVETNNENGFVQIGEMVKVGESWKLTQVPLPLEGTTMELAEGGILLQPTIPGGIGMSEGLSPRMKQLFDQLTELDGKAPQASGSIEDFTKYNVARAALLIAIADESPSEEEKLNWQRTRLEGIAAATQMKTFPNGLEELQKAEQQFRASQADPKLIAFASFHRLFAQYNIDLEKATATPDRTKIQEAWLKSLEGFVTEFPNSEESGDAMRQLAVTYEFNGSIPEATAWYSRLVSTYPQSPAAQHARGALARMDLKGKPFNFTGRGLNGTPINFASYRNKVVLVIFWATWCTPCTEDLPSIQQLYQTHQKDGFEVVGINLDGPGANVQAYLQNYKVTWPQIMEEGGLEGRPATEFGIISLPTMLLIDQRGNVVSNATTVEELKKLVPELVSKK